MFWSKINRIHIFFFKDNKFGLIGIHLISIHVIRLIDRVDQRLEIIATSCQEIYVVGVQYAPHGFTTDFFAVF